MPEPTKEELKKVAGAAAPSASRNVVIITDRYREKAELEQALKEQVCEQSCTNEEKAKVQNLFQYFATSRFVTNFPPTRPNTPCIILAEGFDSERGTISTLSALRSPILPKGFLDSRPGKVEQSRAFSLRHEADHCEHSPKIEYSSAYTQQLEMLADVKAALLGLRDTGGNRERVASWRESLEEMIEQRRRTGGEYALCAEGLREVAKRSFQDVNGASDEQIEKQTLEIGKRFSVRLKQQEKQEEKREAPKSLVERLWQNLFPE